MRKPDYVYEYRINKKGCECFRSRSFAETMEKLKELQAKRPCAQYSMQHRSCHTNKVGTLDTIWGDRAAWGPWFDYRTEATA